MRIYVVKFGEHGNGYTDDTKITAENIKQAALKAQKISDRRISDSMSGFEMDKNSDETKERQYQEWAESAKSSYEVTSIIWDGETED